FEPLSQKDYFSLQAYFTPAIFRDDLPVPNAVEKSAHQAALEEYDRLTKTPRDEIAVIEAPYRQKLHEQKLAKLSPEAQLAHKTSPAERTTEQINQIQETAALVEVTEKEILNAMSKEDRARQKTLKVALARFAQPPLLPMTLALQDPKNSSNKTFILIRGDYNRPGDEVQPGFPAVLRRGELREPVESREKSGPREISPPQLSEGAAFRSTLAEWIASPNNPLTARVM